MKPQRLTKGEVVALPAPFHPAPAATPADPPAPDSATFAESFSQLDTHRRRDGWTAERQHIFITALAATGCVAVAAESASITPRSAYRFRNHAKGAAFAAAWDAALMTAARRLTAVAFERAIMGTPRTVWRNGVPHQETSMASDRLLMFLLRHLNPEFFAPEFDARTRAAAIGAAQARFADGLAALRDSDIKADLLESDDYHVQPPHKVHA